jgi:RpiR family transcriptional regulator, carbohydrate utilization regulator
MKRKEVLSQVTTPNLAERIDHLSIKRQEIIRPILEQPREYVLLSVRAMAARLQTDPATIIRIVQGLGFGSYREFQRHLHEVSLAYATSLDTMQSGGSDGSMPAHVRDSIEQDFRNLHGLKNSLDARRLVALAKRFYEARRIVLIANDLAATIAFYLEYQLSVLGLPVFSGTSAGRILHLVRSVNNKDLVLAISFRRGLRQTIDGAEQARAHGAYCVGIADTYVSPLARVCDELFLASIESTSYSASYAAPIALVDAVLAAVGQYRRTQTLAVAKEIAEEQRKGIRWYNT